MKIIKFVLITFFLYGCISTGNQTKEEKYISSLDYIKDGEYAFYPDNRYNDVFYKGYLKFFSGDGKTTIAVRNINARTGFEDRFIFIVEDDDNGYQRIKTSYTGFSKLYNIISSHST